MDQPGHSDRPPPPPPLTGIRVLELGSFIAAPLATRLLADFGAEVIKVEYPGVGDELRGWRRRRGDTSMLFRTVARNKKSITLDLLSDDGRAVAVDLARRCDVVVENFRPGTLESFDLGPEVLEDINPDLVLVRISGYGQTGPYRDRPGFGGVAEAFAGLRHVTGHPDRDPVRSAAPIGDALAGVYGAVSALMLLLARERGMPHAGPRVADVALYESVYMVMDSLVADVDAYDYVRERNAGPLPGVTPSGIFPCGDGASVMISGNSARSFGRLMRAVGRDDLADDPSLAAGDARYARREEIDAAITHWTTGLTAARAVELLAGARVPAGPVNDAVAIARDEHFAARGMHRSFAVRVDGAADGGAGEPEHVRFPGVVPRIEGAPGDVRWPGPDIGEHTDDVLREVLGRSEAEIAELRARGVL